ncbi:CDP-diacylglycerol--glycerol-3-phosphate 3-phosphatidyltransferase [Fusobacterium mortiferum]|jgi:CDP-diacylglycerol--glycerol-3-phosphate 3-phosphatidyltransferase|uniref:CDP-diacylglycerol--glycerol-3-phosphate 3-phosphatidyltransferase n=2 Tax=Fusobacterium TaxID=848 RepID=A0ABS2G0X5_FUSMR|nr:MULTISPECIES: CDP-diacylglycerol--glycerol-3-phosphate 3-phosphatidyltransferase [Fusobacterium]MBU3842182.1 CDP-diacylglycerol--glycerol-3-phosphate 3-phosphatidyltransferase [Candidatus Fusobacterium pullicola]MBM6691054.1 CDP-diacylglycerol--glycerol-3-phosphate 3-phosphatidyltransferase [Fusobacterium mortiferum]MBM6821306.1 CDP-diacylglycerol--glycerol-3-phosphate 3-phosphatidyltransferase [Fusobacterium mortiferum]MBM6874324.1 CDP-diacylglycerol--glycerol-3-phosphate 3-phosphatidyltran
MNLPNKLTFLRLILAVPFIYFLQFSNEGGFTYRAIAFGIFVVASLTDFFDGYLARKHNLITDFGKIMDPLADKVLVISALVIFVDLGYIPSWMSIVVIAREFLISGIRMLAAAKGEVIPAGNLGKYKTTSQMIVILIMMVFGKNPYNFYMMLIPVILTLWSGWEYTSKAKHYFLNSK